MGTLRRRTPNVAGALFTPVQQRVLALLYGQPNRTFQSSELIRLAKGGTGAVHRQLKRLADAGIVSVASIGNQRHYRANASSPVFFELHGLIVKTVGMVEPIRAALEPHIDEIDAAFIYGSVAAGKEKADSDVDLMVVSDTLDHALLFEAIATAEPILARKVNPTLLTRDEWKERRKVKDSFVARIATKPRLMILGSDDEFA